MRLIAILENLPAIFRKSQVTPASIRPVKILKKVKNKIILRIPCIIDPEAKDRDGKPMSSTGHHICLNVFFPRTPARFALRCRGLRINQCPAGHPPTAGHPEPRHISPHTSMVTLRNAPCGHPQTCGSVRVTQCVLKPDGDVKYPLKRRTG